MPLLYAVISRANTILAKYADCVGNFAEVTEQIIAKTQLENHKLTYSHGNYLIHYICEDRVIYMCITDDVSPTIQNYHYRTCYNFMYKDGIVYLNVPLYSTLSTLDMYMYPL